MPQPTTTSPVTASHTGAPSPTSASHVGDGSTTSASHVEDPQPATASHVGGITLVTTSHIDVTSPTSVHHVGDDSLTSASHIESMSPAIVNDVGGIEKPRHLRRKPKFLCRTCEGNHLTRLCPATAGIPEAWGSPKGPLGSEASVVSPHPVSPLIDMTVMPCNPLLTIPPLSRVMCPLSLLSHILFNLELKKWSYQCNLWSIQLSFWRVMHPSTMSSAFLILHLLNKREFYSPRVLSLQVLEKFPLIGMVLWGIQCLHLCPFQ
jgi:hypothetical protein